ncbi:MAG: hypothetical protein QMC78_02060 [Methanocellales archaeon]|nr:hypothetical protein [Methanocellales archaeon]
MKATIKDILFWIFLLLAVFLLTWKLFGSPSESAIIAAVVTSQAILWKDFSDFKVSFAEFKAEVREFMKEMRKKSKS